MVVSRWVERRFFTFIDFLLFIKIASVLRIGIFFVTLQLQIEISDLYNHF